MEPAGHRVAARAAGKTAHTILRGRLIPVLLWSPKMGLIVDQPIGWIGLGSWRGKSAASPEEAGIGICSMKGTVGRGYRRAGRCNCA